MSEVSLYLLVEALEPVLALLHVLLARPVVV